VAGQNRLALTAENELVIDARRPGQGSDGAYFNFAQAGMNLLENTYRINISGRIASPPTDTTFRIEGIDAEGEPVNLGGTIHNAPLSSNSFNVVFSIGVNGQITQPLVGLRLITNLVGAGAVITVETFTVSDESNDPTPTPTPEPTPTTTPTPEPTPTTTPTPSPQPTPTTTPTPSPQPTPTPGQFHIITYDANGGIFVNPASAISIIPHGDSIGEILRSTPLTFSKTDYRFMGWFADLADADTQWHDNNDVTADITLYAKWAEIPNPETFQVGSVSGNGRVTSGDATSIARFILGQSTDICILAADINGDGVVNIADIILLARWLMGHNVGHLIAH
jgi:uncharacterized repeat protein (TIGR02543 family)